MIELKQKIKKMSPLIKSKKHLLDKQTQILNGLRDQKLEAVKKLKKFQQQYISGVEILNTARQSPDRAKVSTLERSVDYAKAQWYQSLSELRQVEEREKNQIQFVLKAQQELKSVEILKENYEKHLAEALKTKEQKQLDELSIQKFNRQRLGT